MWFGMFGIQVGVMTGRTATLIEAVATAACVTVRTAGQTAAAVAGLASRAVARAVKAQSDIALVTAAGTVAAQGGIAAVAGGRIVLRHFIGTARTRDTMPTLQRDIG